MSVVIAESVDTITVLDLDVMRIEILELRAALRVARQQAALDGLTGLANRWWFDAALTMSESRAERDSSVVGIIVLDLDGLKAVNDEHGHAAGDGLLLLTAGVLHRCTRQGDLAARLGGDEFAVLTHAAAGGVRALVERLRLELGAEGVAASVGWAMRSPEGGLLGAQLAADQRMRANKPRAGSPRRPPGDGVGPHPLASALSARLLLAEATGVIMHRQQCGAERARLELAALAQLCSVSVHKLAGILLAVTAHQTLPADEIPPGRQLTRLLDLAEAARAAAQPSFGVTSSSPPVADPARLLATSVGPAPPPAARQTTPTRVVNVVGRCIPADSSTGSGGDWLDAFVLPDGAVALAVGDVAGHDGAAAAVMEQARTLLRGFAVDSAEPPSSVLHRLETAMVALDAGLLATALFARIEQLPQGELLMTWSNAGHPPPVLISTDGLATSLPCGDDLLVGSKTPAARADLRVKLGPGNGLLLYTDGLIERRREHLDQGITRLCAAVTASRLTDPVLLCEEVIEAMLRDCPPRDDVALMVLRVGGLGRTERQP